jgi:hypothetical protein
MGVQVGHAVTAVDLPRKLHITDPFPAALQLFLICLETDLS